MCAVSHFRCVAANAPRGGIVTILLACRPLVLFLIRIMAPLKLARLATQGLIYRIRIYFALIAPSLTAVFALSSEVIGSVSIYIKGRPIWIGQIIC